MDNDRTPIADLATLNAVIAEHGERDMIEGYLAGLFGDGHEPGIEFNRLYWHGWRNGMADKRRLPIDEAMRKLAYEIVSENKRR